MRLIDAENFKNYISSAAIRNGTDAGRKIANLLIEVIDELPTVEAKEVVHGEWGTDRFGLDRSVCSICGAVYEGDGGNFCPKCGADMRTSAE